MLSVTGVYGGLVWYEVKERMMGGLEVAVAVAPLLCVILVVHLLVYARKPATVREAAPIYVGGLALLAVLYGLIG